MRQLSGRSPPGRNDAEHRDIRLALGALRRILDDPVASAEEISFVVRESAKLQAQADRIRLEAELEVGRCLLELKKLTGLEDAELLSVINDGSLDRACCERLAELKATP